MRTATAALLAALATACGLPGLSGPEGDAPAATPSTASTSSTEPSSSGPVPSHSPMPAAPGTPSPSPAATPEVLLAAGDIAWCGPDEADTGALLRRDPEATVAALGDLAYHSGTPEEFAECYLPAWGHALERTRPAPGNHDAATADLAGYFGVFGDRAGQAPAGYYSYDLGEHWHVVVLNSNCTRAAPCSPDGAQAEWLRRDLAAAGDRHVIAYWHHARFSSGQYGHDPRTAPFWALLDEAGAALVLAGHEHDYERLTTVSGDGTPDPNGIRPFVVGTGGAVLRDFPAEPLPTTEFRDAEHHGVLRLELHRCSYRWAFVTTDAGAIDEGTHRLC